jgi:hypothetical protein
VEPGTEGLVLALGPAPKQEGRSVKVRVHGDGPVPAFKLQIKTTASTSTVTGREGRAQFTLPADERPGSTDGDHPVHLEVFDARGGDEQPLNLLRAQVDGVPEGSDEVEIQLRPGLRIEGRVLTATGKVARYVTVRAWKGDESERPWHMENEVRTDALGRFRLVGLEPGLQTLLVDAPAGHAAGTPITVSAGTLDVVLTLKGAVTHRLRVLSTDGAPVARAHVTLASERHSPSDSTDDEGRIEFVDLDPDREWTLHVAPPDGRPDLKPLNEPSWALVDGDVRLESGRVIAGFVRDERGEAVEAALVWIADGDHRRSVATDARGAFRLGPVPEGRVRLCAKAPGLLPRDEEMPVEEFVLEASRSEAVLTVAAGLRVNVRIEGLPEEHGECRLYGGRAGAEPRQFDLEPAGERSAYALRGLDPQSRYWFWCGVDDRRYVLHEIDPRGGDVLLRIREGRSIRGRVVNAVLGDRIQVGARNAVGIGWTVWSDREGRFTFDGLPPGAWSLSCWDYRYDGQHVAVAEVEAGSTVDLVLEPRK